MSERRACELIGVGRSTCRYQRGAEGEGDLRAARREVALERPRWGYRRLKGLLSRRGWKVNWKRG